MDFNHITYVVFTGAAVDRFGKRLYRKKLKPVAEKVGFVIQDRVDSKTQLLVSARTDTIKAMKAAASGIPTCTYSDFIDECVARQ